MTNEARGWSAVPSAASALTPSAPRRTGRSAVGRGLLLTLGGVLMVAALLLVMVAIGADTGLAGFAAGFVFSLVPVCIVLPALLWLDRLEAEPVGQLLFAFGWGALVATSVALVVNTYSVTVLTQHGGSVSTTAVLVAPWVEETCKGAAVLVVLLWRRQEFDGVVDGIVYAGLAGLGFAFTENVLYLGRALQEDGSSGLAMTFVLRCVFGPFAHPLFTMAIGVGLGIAVQTTRTWLKVVAPLAGLLVAVLLHGLWNLSAVAGLRGFVGVYVAVQVPIFAAAVGFAVWARRRESRLIRRHLQVYVASGWFTAAEAQMLGSTSERRRARAWARQVAGPPGRRAMRGFQAAATELAFARDRATRTSASHGGSDVERYLLQEVTAQRYALLGGR
ncbi:PrsW family intramembrane metalloprotease [Angustibacter sp. McL0619]|uniref:PrsW family intramembrane metalloprotease n=1 Tax=Angustibacter sp. McL0619 TaxID=3415676 RepID=UPI003CF244F8